MIRIQGPPWRDFLYVNYAQGHVPDQTMEVNIGGDRSGPGTPGGKVSGEKPNNYEKMNIATIIICQGSHECP